MDENFLRFIWFVSGMMINEGNVYLNGLRRFMSENDLSDEEQRYFNDMIDHIEKTDTQLKK